MTDTDLTIQFNLPPEVLAAFLEGHGRIDLEGGESVSMEPWIGEEAETALAAVLQLYFEKNPRRDLGIVLDEVGEMMGWP